MKNRSPDIRIVPLWQGAGASATAARRLSEAIFLSGASAQSAGAVRRRRVRRGLSIEARSGSNRGGRVRLGLIRGLRLGPDPKSAGGRSIRAPIRTMEATAMSNRSERRRFSWTVAENRLAKAETLLALSLLIEWVIMPWIKAAWRFPPWLTTLTKMALVVGLFGPAFAVARDIIDAWLDATRKVSRKYLFVPQVLFHAAVFALLFVGFYRSMHGAWPWSGARWFG